MNETFKIRKNKSQKEINLNMDHRRRSPLLVTQHPYKPKVSAHQHFNKVTQLQPLMRTKTSVHNHQIDKSNPKLDFTQPIPPKSTYLNKNEGSQLTSIENHLSLKQNQQDKENCPGHSNDLKCPSIPKIQSTYLKHNKYDSLGLLTNTTEGIPCFRIDKEQSYESTKTKNGNKKSSKMTLLKSCSRTKLNKIVVKNPVATQVVYANEIETQPDLSSQRTFRKGIINKIFSHPKNQGLLPQVQGQNSLKEPVQQMASKDDSQRESLDQKQLQSPVAKKGDMSLSWGNCSTIKEQEENSPSFISKQAIEELISPKQTIVPISIGEEKFHQHRKVRLESERMKKKFPQNFFK